MGKKILIVDDDVDFQETVRLTLESEGFDVVSASDGKQGLEVARREKPDLIILDVMMSWVLDGLGMGAQLEQDPELKKIPVIMVSAIASTEHAGEFPTDQPLPADEFISKPVKGADLLARVKKRLSGRVSA